MKKVLLFLFFNTFLFAGTDYLTFLKKEFERENPKCQKGSASACYNAGVTLSNLKHMGEKVDYEEIIKYFEIACKANISSGCQALGSTYGNNLKDEKKAFDAFKKGCELKDSTPCWQLGQAYELGLGVGQDYEKAAKFYEKSILLAQFSYQPFYRLGLLYMNGKGISKDKNKACELLKKACKISGNYKEPCEMFKKCN